jgi:hypothetical protein
MKRYFALGRKRAQGMNGLEKKYSEVLEGLKADGEVLWWKFEGIKFKLADKTFYSPDFAVLFKDFTMEIHETKGFMMDDANVKIKVAAAMYPFKFVVVKWNKKDGWSYREV